MKKKIVYEDVPLGKIRRIENFLPPAEKLVLKKKSRKRAVKLSKP
jgi:hypothetical protein